MQSAIHPANEQERIEALNDTGLLDTPAEQLFDSITDTLAALLDMPISLVCLVDSERVWLKSSFGLDGVSDIQRDIGFCPHTITQKDIFEIKDASLDNRFHDSPVVAGEPHLRYYAGAPLITSDGYALGTLCVMDYQARELTQQQRIQLKNLATTTTALIEARRQLNIYQASKEFQLGSAIEMSPDETYLVDRSTGKIKYANRAALLSIGISLQKLTELLWSEVLIQLPGELIESYLNTDKSFFSTPINFTGTHQRSDGSTYPVDCQIQSNGPHSNTFLIICRDISDRVEAEDREKSLQNSVAHMGRINTASMLSSGLAHELNQPLTAISQYCDTALSAIEKDNIHSSLIYDSLQKATTQALRAGEIIKRYRAFTQKRLPTRTFVDINKLIEDTVNLLSHDITKKNIILNVNISNNLPPANIDPIQIQQVLLNLATNCIEALSEFNQGEIDIDCNKTDNEMIKFAITDNGPGIDHALLDNLLMPKTSSKPNGTGLGLNICNYIVNLHAGKIWHDTAHTNGTRIVFTIPLHTDIHE